MDDKRRVQMKIEIISPIECKVSRQDGELLKPCLSFPAYYYKQKQYKKERIDYHKHVFTTVTPEHCYFWLGLLSRVKKYCKSKNIKCQITGSVENLTSIPIEPNVPGYNFHNNKYAYQLQLIKAAILKKRGVIKAATGSGKTIVQLGIASCFPKEKCIIFAHTLDIVSQTVEKAKKAGFDVGIFAEGKKETDKQITVATIQSIGNPIMVYEDLLKVMGKSADKEWWSQREQIQNANLSVLAECSGYDSVEKLLKSKTQEAIIGRKRQKETDNCIHALQLLANRTGIEQSAKTVLDFLAENTIVMVDEGHHIATIEGSYVHALSHTFAPIRLAFTATLPTNEEATLSLEGLIGPVIEELTINEATNLGVLAKPKIKIIRSPYNHEVDREYNYQKAYDIGIVNNIKRNELIINTAIDYINEDKSILIMVNKIAHGENLISTARDICNIPKKEFDSVFRYVQGKTTSEQRGFVKNALNNKKIRCVISTVIWKEGVDIPSLDVVINGGGGKDEKTCLQILGRGLRRTGTKNTVIIVDIFDPHNHHLLNHFGERLYIYSKNDWL